MPITSNFLEKQGRATRRSAAERMHKNGAPPSPGVTEREQRRKREDEAFARMLGEPRRYDG